MASVLSTQLLVQQIAVADASQPGLAGQPSGNAVVTPSPGVAAIGVGKLGLITTTHFVAWSAGVMEGEVTIEVAEDPSRTDPWASAGVVTFAGSSPQLNYAVIVGGFGAYRHRITAPVVGGSVTTKLVGSE